MTEVKKLRIGQEITKQSLTKLNLAIISYHSVSKIKSGLKFRNKKMKRLKKLKNEETVLLYVQFSHI